MQQPLRRIAYKQNLRVAKHNTIGKLNHRRQPKLLEQPPKAIDDSMTNRIADAIIERIKDDLSPCLLDRHKMAERLTISVSTLDRLTTERTIPSVLVGSRRLYNPQKVIDALENGAIK